jgi:hypothetical protein
LRDDDFSGREVLFGANCVKLRGLRELYVLRDLQLSLVVRLGDISKKLGDARVKVVCSGYSEAQMSVPAMCVHKESASRNAR